MRTVGGECPYIPAVEGVLVREGGVSRLSISLPPTGLTVDMRWVAKYQ
jgi:hypothetical protein